MSCLMSISYLSEISDSLEKSLPPNIVFEIIDSQEERFVIDFNKSMDSFDIKFRVVGTEARVSCFLEFDLTEDIIKNRILAMLAFNTCQLDSIHSKKYRFTLWSGEKDFKSIPNLDVLNKKDNLVLELSSRPCQIDTAKLAFKKISAVLIAFNSWLDKDVLETVTYSVAEPVEEGASFEVIATRYERSKINRDICIKYHGWSCKVCSTDLQTVYGDLAKEFIHVHHIEKLADSGSRVIDPINDLIPVCPNCHSMIHRTKEPAMPEEIERLIMKNKSLQI